MSFLSASTVQPPVEPATAESAAAPSGLVITAGGLRVWGIRSAFSLLDQILTSAASFGVNVVLARWMPPEVYGAFAVAFATFIFISGIYNALLLEPLSVMGPSRHASRLLEYFRRQLAVHVLLVGGLSAIILVFAAILWLVAPNGPLPGAVAGGGIALPFLLLLWLARRMCYVLQRAATAVLGSSFYALFVLAGLLALRHFGWLSPFSAFLLTGAGSLLAAFLLFRAFRLPWSVPQLDAELTWRSALAEDWHYGRWVVGSTLLNSISTQVQTVLVALFLGLGSAGILRAMQLPMLAMINALGAAGPLVLPSFSYDFGKGRTQQMRHKARWVSLGLGATELCFVALLALLAAPAEHLMFAGKYAAYAWMMPVLCFIPVCLAISMGFAAALRASHRPHFDLMANAVAAPVAVLSALVFMWRWGLAGAVASMVLGSIVYLISVVWTFRAQPSASWQPESRS